MFGHSKQIIMFIVKGLSSCGDTKVYANISYPLNVTDISNRLKAMKAKSVIRSIIALGLGSFFVYRVTVLVVIAYPS